MNAHKFVAEHGIDKAREVVEGAPDLTATHYSFEDNKVDYYQKTNNLIYWDNDYDGWFEVYFELPELISLSELKHVVESVELVDSYNGPEMAKRFIEENMDCSDSVRLEKAIIDYKFVESYKGGKND